MAYEELVNLLQHVGKDPSRLIFEDELTGISNRRFLHNYFEYKVSWDALMEHPLSLLMMDVDGFKQINDKHGHESGDQALVWVTARLKEVAGEAGLPIRYAGDEFVLLLPNANKTEALAVGERLLQRVREEPCLVEDGKVPLRVTLSIGVATAPDDAETGKALLQKADTALYYVKKSGRDGVANAAQLDPQKVSAKAALHQLEAANIAGRGLQLVEVAEAFKRFSRGQSQILLIQGGSGMGKTTFLETIRRNLSQSEVAVAKLNGNEQEVFHPYCLVTHLVSALLNVRPDQGTAIFEALSPDEAAHLGRLLPHLSDAGSPSVQEGAKAKIQREALASTLVHFIPKILDSRPLILLIDDLHFADEASLLILQLMIRTQEVPVFICGTSLETDALTVHGRVVPLEAFCAKEQDGIAVRKVSLSPLNAADIAVHLRGIFPQLSLPENVARDLERVSQGNPQFLSELIRKLVLDQKVVLVGQRWVIEPFEDGYLPKSLEDIVRQKIATLDEGSRQLLAHASTFGEDVSLSSLAGSTDGRESEVLDFVDKAIAQGLLSSDFQTNDQTIRFRGRGVQEVTYSDIPTEQKQELHERIASYQENLYQQGLLPSAGPLIYHYKRSTEPEKAGTYELIQAEYDKKVFNAEEAASYTGNIPDVPLDTAALSRIPTAIRLFLTAVRSIKLYPPESKAILTVTEQLKEAINHIVEPHGRLSLMQQKGVLLVNGQKMEVAEFKPVATSFLEALNGIDLEGVAFERGYSDQELKVLIEGLGRVERKMLDRRFWQRFAAEHGLRQIKLKQVRFTEKLDATLEPSVEIDQLVSAEQKLDREDLPRLNEILRCLLSAARNVKIYPPKSKTVSNAIAQLNEALIQGLSKRPVITFARAGKALLVNGEKVDTTEFKAVAEGFLEFLPSVGLSSLTFAEPASLPELQQFMEAISQAPATGFGSQFWKTFAKDHSLTSLHFDQRLYELRETQAGKLGDAQKPVAPPPEPLYTAGEAEVTPETLNDLLLKGEKEQIALLVAKLFEGYKQQDLVARRKAVELCRRTVDHLPIGFQQSFTELVADPLIGALGEETDAKVFGDLATTLHKMAANLILFGAYLLASRIFFQLQERQRQLQDAKDSRGPALMKIMNEKLETSTQQLLVDDLKSADSDRQQRAAQVLGGLGRGVATLLVDVIKQTDDLRVRQLAASLLKEQGGEAANVIKREVALEVSPQERVRILDVIDTVTKELRTEFSFVLDGDNAQVHDAAFRLAERLNDKKVIEVLLDYAKNGDSQLAAGAIKCLGRLKPAGTSPVLISLLNAMKDTDRIVACCRALGQIADPASITPLAKLLVVPKGFFAFGRKRSPLVRATAAFALGQIPHPQAAKALAAHINDQDPRVKKIARSRPKT